MINVSGKYIQSALSPGRRVKCFIAVGEHVYGDKEILSFEFNDIVHPEDMAFGTTCANRFNFELWSRRSIQLSEVIKPYIGFEGDADTEYCCLGEFYITRRYRRRERYSITCYDKMYRLDSRYRPKVEVPCSAREVLADIAEQHGFTSNWQPSAADEINSVSKQTTCREMLGYIAGLSGGFAKFNRTGVLELKVLQNSNFTLSRKNYSDLQLKADTNEVRCVQFDNGEEVLSEGKGTRLTTYRQYNPYATGEITKRVFTMWSGFTYHGLSVKLQGLPFLEAGETISVQDDFEDKQYFALISEHNLYYDGQLRGALVSKSKDPIEDYDAPESEQRQLEYLTENLRMRYFSDSNEKAVTIGTRAVEITGISFSLEESNTIGYNASFTVTAADSAVLTLTYMLNNKEISHQVKTALNAGKPECVTLYNCFRNVRAGGNTLAVTAQLDTGTAVINAGDLIAVVSAQYAAGGEGPKRPVINIEETIGLQYINTFSSFGIKPFSHKFKEPELIAVHRRTINESIGRHGISQMQFSTK